MNINTVIFDMDGVLANSETLWNDIDGAMLAEHGVTYAGEHKHQVLGKSFGLSLQFYKDQFNLQPSIEHLTERRISIATDYYAKHIEMYADAPHVLQTLRERGLRIGMATSSVSTLALAFLERHKLRDFFDTIVGGEEVEHGKPNPDIYLRAAEKLEAQPTQCLVVEDSLAGVQAGKSAAMTVAAIPDPQFADARDYKGKADFILTRLDEVLGVLDELQSSRQE
jgi:HAD superfamily hydrolase (TIGR01509 family)